ncbi:hypothetical protein HanPI659440_Chr16g0640641 [Helianthus annuus]|nr:hypothetical protein HanPI659440_Chr16g0640641 [Helianthus annuus]KAJ0895507.1 hypothetical protein HanPSC8_Chr09g0401361 [Helianthus annuus]
MISIKVSVVAVAVSIGLHDGVESSSFAIAVVMAFIVMYDASGFRLHVGRQAEVLNQTVCEFPPEHPLSTSRPLRLLGILHYRFLFHLKCIFFSVEYDYKLDFSGLFTGHTVHGLRVQFGAAGYGSRVDMLEG